MAHLAAVATVATTAHLAAVATTVHLLSSTASTIVPSPQIVLIVVVVIMVELAVLPADHPQDVHATDAITSAIDLADHLDETSANSIGDLVEVSLDLEMDLVLTR